MPCNNISISEKPVAMYVTDAGTLTKHVGGASYWTTLKENKYIPLLSFIKLDSVNEFRFTTGENISSDIVSYNEHTSSQRPLPNILNNSRINVTANDLFVGGITMCLNFTKYCVTLVSSFGIPKMYRPLDNVKFPEYEGSLVFFTIHTVNSPQSVKNSFGYQNYLEKLYANRSGGHSLKDEEFSETLNFILNNLHNNRSITDTVASDTLKIATVITVSQEEFFYKKTKQDVYIQNKGILASLNSVVDVSPHPSFIDAVIDDKAILEGIRENGVSCFIVDNEDLIGDRYINFAGQVIKVPKHKNRDKVNGLYIGSLDSDKHFTTENLTSLDDLEQNRYLYKSAEEALDGGDLKKKFMEESELRKVIRAEEALNSKMAYEESYRKLEEKSRERILDIEERSRVRINELEEQARISKLEHEDQLRKFSIDSEKTKQVTGREKHKQETKSLKKKVRYEEDRYRRDSTVETIKTIGAIAALGLGIFALYSKFSK